MVLVDGSLGDSNDVVIIISSANPEDDATLACN